MPRKKVAVESEMFGLSKVTHAATLQTALGFHEQGLLDEAEALYQEILRSQPVHFDALQLLATIAAQKKNSLESIKLFERALNIHPDCPGVLNNYGNALSELKRYEEALASYDRAIAEKPDYADAYNNRGVTLKKLKRYDEALLSYEKLIDLQPGYADVYYNYGNTLFALKRYEDAISNYSKVLALKPDYAKAFYNRGVALQILARYEDAALSYEEALAIKPDYDFLFGLILYVRMKICDWSCFDHQIKQLAEKIEHSEKVTPPFSVLAIADSLSLQKGASRIYVLEKYPRNQAVPTISNSLRHYKIRIGYYSADFHDHATAYLMAGLFEKHDRSRFELIAFSFGSTHHGEMRKRVVAAFDRFFDVQDKSDQEVVQLSRELEIDIAVDLKGFTTDCRTGIFALRAAPIQVNYLGYPGTMGADYMDYLLADRTLIPEQSREYYTEKIVYLPNCYQVNDIQRVISEKVFTREELGLPKTGFIFCCFNNNYKITPSTFGCWMRILKQVEGSVIWLFEDNPKAAENLRQEAVLRGVQGDRLVFAKLMPLSEHLARHRLADLFLDTFPCNAYTTASDALWAGLPLVTLVGESFASRVAASLLNAILMPELITSTQEEYETLAIELALNPEKLTAIRQKLEKNQLTTPLFDTERFTRNIEEAYMAMYERYQEGLPPEHIVLSSPLQERGSCRKPERGLEHGIAVASETALSPTCDPAAMFQTAFTFHEQGRLNEAEALYQEILRSQPGHFDALQLLATIAAQKNDSEEAVVLFDRALIINPDHPSTHNNRGNALKELRRYEEALASYDKAIELKADYAEVYNNKGLTLSELKRNEEALLCYNKAVALKADFSDAYYNQGNILLGLKRNEEALLCYDKALTLKADYVDAYYNKGNSLLGLQRYEEAVLLYDKVLELKPDYATAYYNCGVALQMVSRYQDAVLSYEKALALKPGGLFWLGMFLYAKMWICDWSAFDYHVGQLAEKIERHEKASPPFIFTITDSLSLQKETAKLYVQEKYPINCLLPEIPRRNRRDKIRIGYYSADFHDHATAYLMAGLFEAHDLSMFEFIAFSFGPENHDVMRKRIAVVFDRFYNVQTQSDREVALLSRELGIDIAVDLNGFTGGARMGIFALRAAPIQVNYLGYPGTTSADYIDYLIADRTVIPECSRLGYTEKIVYLPDSYQVNDAQRTISEKVFSREEFGLPKTGFVFCCFNNNYKVIPATFDGWMRILKKVKGSVLWLLEDNVAAASNLRSEAIERGVDADRLIFAKRVPLAEHLARHRLADLFLDTFPCNAHTTASDALWAGLPLLTLAGESFASRVAASLLNATLLPELITSTQEEYETLAIELALNPEKLTSIRQKLERNRLTTPLFDTGRFTRNIEEAYVAMYERYQEGLPPEHIVLLSPLQERVPCRKPGAGLEYGIAVASETGAVPLPDHAAMLQTAFTFHEQGRLNEAEALYEEILRLQPGHVDALQLLATIAAQKKNSLYAIELFDRVLAINHDHFGALNNRGNALRELRRYEEALASYEKVVTVKPDYFEVYYNRGIVLTKLMRNEEALASYDKACALRPDFDYLFGMRLHAKMWICDWSALDYHVSQLSEKIERLEKASPPFQVLAIADSPSLQKVTATLYVQQKYPVNHLLSEISKFGRHDKIRIGYFSADFHDHATTYLMAELFERHDRTRFELTAFSFGPDSNDSMRSRVFSVFDRFIDVQIHSDREVALLSRELEIDIAVDLKGFTQDSRTGIFALRAAPIQVSYLGYPGTMGADYIDYIIADRTVIPESSRNGYTEKIVYLPDCYQVNDTRRSIADKVFTREEFGLPRTGFVFCSFNNNYKITPSTFDGWMRILKKVKGSVLWLLEGDVKAVSNLRREAIERGVDADRLIFAKRMPLAEHLARHRLADLFLDTFPCNAHTTASDALWAGLPLLTLAGESFAGRVAASLLNAILMPELIASTQEEYEALAIEVATNPEKLVQIRRKLARNRLTTPLFDTRLFTRHIEAAYGVMYERYQDDLLPDHIFITSAK